MTNLRGMPRSKLDVLARDLGCKKPEYMNKAELRDWVEAQRARRFVRVGTVR